MASLDETDHMGETQMDSDLLFAELQRAANDSERQALVNNALRSGVELRQLREMLDEIEACGRQCCCSRQDPGSRSPKIGIDRKRSWVSFFSH